MPSGKRVNIKIIEPCFLVTIILKCCVVTVYLEYTPAEIGRAGVFEIGRVVNSTDLENT